VHILKFGGTSVADTSAIKRSVAIIKAQPACKIVVVSAAGGVTNALLAIATATNSATIEANKTFIFERQQAIAAAIPQHDPVHQHLPLLYAELDTALPCHGAARDRLLSLGERFSAPLIAAFLRLDDKPAEYAPATEWLKTSASSASTANFNRHRRFCG